MERGWVDIAKEETLGLLFGKDLRITSDFRYFLYPVFSFPTCFYPPPSTSHDALQLRWMMLPFSRTPGSFLICHAIGFQAPPHPPPSAPNSQSKEAEGGRNVSPSLRLLYSCTSWLTSVLGKLVPVSKHHAPTAYREVEINLWVLVSDQFHVYPQIGRVGPRVDAVAKRVFLPLPRIEPQKIVVLSN
jgi:hypothetical protein